MAEIVTEAQLLATFSGGQPDQIAMQNLIHTLFSGAVPSIYNSQPAPTAIDATATLTIADLLTGIITCTTQARFRTRKTAANTYVTYRVA